MSSSITDFLGKHGSPTDSNLYYSIKPDDYLPSTYTIDTRKY